MSDNNLQKAKRIEESKALIAEYKAQNYKAEAVTMDIVKANIYAFSIMLLPLIIMFWGYKYNYGSILLNTKSYFIFLAAFIAEIVLHELIHGFTWGLSTGKHFKDIHFGVIWKMLTPYCYCSSPMKKGFYLLGGVMPTVILGIVQYVIAMFLGSSLLLWLACGGLLGGGADIFISALIIKKVSGKESLVLDHPSEIGCIVLKKLQPGETCDDADEVFTDEGSADTADEKEKTGGMGPVLKLAIFFTLATAIIVFVAAYYFGLFGDRAGSSTADEKKAVMEKTEDLSWVKSMTDIIELYNIPGFKNLSDEEQYEFIEGAVRQIQESYGIAEYTIELKTKPAHIEFTNQKGIPMVWTLEGFDPEKN